VLRSPEITTVHDTAILHQHKSRVRDAGCRRADLPLRWPAPWVMGSDPPPSQFTIRSFNGLKSVQLTTNCCQMSQLARKKMPFVAISQGRLLSHF